jgi:hypothetical protein
MSRLPIQQLRGLKDLLQETVDAATSAIEETHQAIARQPFALLERVDAIAAPVRAIEHLERTVTGSVYPTIRTVNRLSGILATQVLDCLEEPENPL